MSKDPIQDAGRPALHTLQPLTIPTAAPPPASGSPPTILNVSGLNVANSPIPASQTQAQPETLGSGCNIASDLALDLDPDITPAQAIAEAEDQDKAEKERRGASGISLSHLETCITRLMRHFSQRLAEMDKPIDILRCIALAQAIHAAEPPRKPRKAETMHVPRGRIRDTLSAATLGAPPIGPGKGHSKAEAEARARA